MKALKWLVALLIVCGGAYGGYRFFWMRGESLRYSVKAGDVFRYKMAMNGTGTVTAGMPNPIPITMTGSSIYRVKVLSVDESGKFKASWKLESTKYAVQAMGMQQPSPTTPAGLEITLVSYPNGHLAEKPTGGDLSQSQMFGAAASAQSFAGFLGMGMDYPKRHIPVGGSWKDNTAMKVPVAMGPGSASNVKTTLHSTQSLVKVTTVSGRRIGKFRNVSKGTSGGSDKFPMTMTFKGNQTVNCYLDNGMPAGGTGSVDMTMESNPNAKTPGPQMHTDMQISMTLTRLPVQPLKKKHPSTHAKGGRLTG